MFEVGESTVIQQLLSELSLSENNMFLNITVFYTQEVMVNPQIFYAKDFVNTGLKAVISLVSMPVTIILSAYTTIKVDVCSVFLQKRE